MFKKYFPIIVNFRDNFETEFKSKDYSYLTDIEDIKVDDLVVVDTVYGPQIGKVKQIRGVAKMWADRATKLAFMKLDLDKLEESKETLARITELKSELRSRKEEMEEIQLLQLMAATDPTAKQLLAQLAELTGDESFKSLAEPFKYCPHCGAEDPGAEACRWCSKILK